MNISLNGLDKFIVTLQKKSNPPFHYIRYADNSALGTKGSIRDNPQITIKIKDFLEKKLSLKITGCAKRKRSLLGYYTTTINQRGRIDYAAPIGRIDRKVQGCKSVRTSKRKKQLKKAAKGKLDKPARILHRLPQWRISETSTGWETGKK